MTIERQDCAKMIRGALKSGFPGTKFSVRGSSYSMGHSIDVSWTDGPTGAQVKPILDRFESKGFDGMTDCSFSCGDRLLNGVQVFIDGGYVRGSRSVSPQLHAKVADRLAYDCGLGPLTFDKYGNISVAGNDAGNLRVPFQWWSHWHRDADGNSDALLSVDDIEGAEHLLASDSREGEYFTRLVSKIEAALSLEDQKPIPAELLPEYIDINATVSTGRTEFEPRQPMFEGHAEFDAERAAIAEFDTASTA